MAEGRHAAALRPDAHADFAIWLAWDRRAHVPGPGNLQLQRQLWQLLAFKQQNQSEHQVAVWQSREFRAAHIRHQAGDADREGGRARHPRLRLERQPQAEGDVAEERRRNRFQVNEKNVSGWTSH